MKSFIKCFLFIFVSSLYSTDAIEELKAKAVALEKKNKEMNNIINIFELDNMKNRNEKVYFLEALNSNKGKIFK